MKLMGSIEVGNQYLGIWIEFMLSSSSNLLVFAVGSILTPVSPLFDNFLKYALYADGKR